MRLWWFACATLMVCQTISFAASASQRERGASIFVESGCLHCHSIRNRGGHRGPDLSGVGRRLSKRRIRRQILEGSKVMPAFRDDLQPTELADLITYLRSCRDKR